MRDPFPIPPIPALSKAIQPLADYFSLPTLPLHIHEILVAALLYQAICAYVAPALSNWLVPRQYKALSPSKRLNWNVHVVSFTQSSLINILSLWVIFADQERWNMDSQERVWGYTGAAGMVQALATGYFVWDLAITVLNLHAFGLGMLAHAISACLVYSFGFRPFINYYGCIFTLWELSSPFLNIHWFFDKLGMTGTRGQLYNGIMLIATFFSCRLVFGTYQSFKVFSDIWAAMQRDPMAGNFKSSPGNNSLPLSYSQTMIYAPDAPTIPFWLGAIYLASNLTLNFLNFYWFVKMIDAVRKRFEPSKKKTSERPVDSIASGTGLKDASGAGIRRRAKLDAEEDEGHPPPLI